ncbi:MAG: permease-like cell division protein FtsX [Elusimicrobiaceae bacterium]|nr:permease-like cell division protein FtsX [Elusimicrobiota bacterium]
MTENKLSFTAQSRIIFFLLALALLVQGALFLRLQAYEAFDVLLSDFKIAVVLNNASSAETESFTKKLNSLPGVTEVRYLNAKEALAMPGASSEQNGFEVFLPKEDFLPAFFELRVNKSVMMNPQPWVAENFSKMPQDAQAYYKESQAASAIYLDGVIKFINIILGLSVFFFLAFCFLVEAYYTRITALPSRLGGLLCGFLSYALALGAGFILISPLKLAAVKAFKFDLWPQAACLLLCLMLGWTLSKWKKF